MTDRTDSITTEELDRYCELRHEPIVSFMARTDNHFKEVFARLNQAMYGVIGLLVTVLVALVIWIVTERSMFQTNPTVNINLDETLLKKLAAGR
jgi:hypothetical protein